jgi:hypothetical protein
MPDLGYNPKVWANSGFSPLFDLRTGKLMRMEVVVVKNKEKRTQALPVDLADGCPKKDTDSFLEVAR